MQAFWIALVMIFLAELGDKTQLVALCFATRFRAGVVVAGITVATLLVHVVSVLLGGAAGKLLPKEWILLLAGLAFVGFGLWTLRGDDLDEGECDNRQGKSPFMIVAITFFLAELGDKTMLSTVALAAKYPMFPVWLGSTVGMVASDGLAIIVGKLMGANLPERTVKIGASIIFFIFGIYSIVEGGIHLPSYSWAIVAICSGAMVAFFFRKTKPMNSASAGTVEVANGENEQSVDKLAAKR